MSTLYWIIGLSLLVWLFAFICYKMFAHPPVWYDDLAPKDYNDNDRWWGEE